MGRSSIDALTQQTTHAIKKYNDLVNYVLTKRNTFFVLFPFCNSDREFNFVIRSTQIENRKKISNFYVFFSFCLRPCPVRDT